MAMYPRLIFSHDPIEKSSGLSRWYSIKNCNTARRQFLWSVVRRRGIHLLANFCYLRTFFTICQTDILPQSVEFKWWDTLLKSTFFDLLPTGCGSAECFQIWGCHSVSHYVVYCTVDSALWGILFSIYIRFEYSWPLSMYSLNFVEYFFRRLVNNCYITGSATHFDMIILSQ